MAQQLQPPRIPKLTAPASLAPQDVLKAQGANDQEVVNALIREPLGAVGLAVPELPSPATLGAQALGQLPAPPVPGLAPRPAARREEGPPVGVRTRILGSGYRAL